MRLQNQTRIGNICNQNIAWEWLQFGDRLGGAHFGMIYVLLSWPYVGDGNSRALAGSPQSAMSVLAWLLTSLPAATCWTKRPLRPRAPGQPDHRSLDGARLQRPMGRSPARCRPTARAEQTRAAD